MAAHPVPDIRILREREREEHLHAYKAHRRNTRTHAYETHRKNTNIRNAQDKHTHADLWNPLSSVLT